MKHLTQEQLISANTAYVKGYQEGMRNGTPYANPYLDFSDDLIVGIKDGKTVEHQRWVEGLGHGWKVLHG